MPRITISEAKAWAEPTKLLITSLDTELLNLLEEEILSRISSAYTVTGWTNETNTPRLVRAAIAKAYVAWVYRRSYSEALSDTDTSYADQLLANSELIVSGIVDGSIEVPGEPEPFTGSPAFYPTDASSLLEPTVDDPSLGPSKFSMGMVF